MNSNMHDFFETIAGVAMDCSAEDLGVSSSQGAGVFGWDSKAGNCAICEGCGAGCWREANLERRGRVSAVRGT